jgi:hypothetical protein
LRFFCLGMDIDIGPSSHRARTSQLPRIGRALLYWGKSRCFEA